MQGDLKCPKCDKANIRFRIKTNSYVCNICGHFWYKIKEKKEEDVDG